MSILPGWLLKIGHIAFPTVSRVFHQNLPKIACLSNYDDDLSMEALLKRIDDFQKREELSTIESLEKEISTLKCQISCHQRSLRVTLDLLQEGFDAAVLIKTALQACDEEEEMANADWLAFWGIYIEPRSALEYRPMEWPQEWI